jgi:hypothetical protein
MSGLLPHPQCVTKCLTKRLESLTEATTKKTKCHKLNITVIHKVIEIVDIYLITKAVAKYRSAREDDCLVKLVLKKPIVIAMTLPRALSVLEVTLPRWMLCVVAHQASVNLASESLVDLGIPLLPLACCGHDRETAKRHTQTG